jgi:hypothetical protein
MTHKSKINDGFGIFEDTHFQLYFALYIVGSVISLVFLANTKLLNPFNEIAELVGLIGFVMIGIIIIMVRYNSKKNKAIKVKILKVRLWKNVRQSRPATIEVKTIQSLERSKKFKGFLYQSTNELKPLNEYRSKHEKLKHENLNEQIEESSKELYALKEKEASESKITDAEIITDAISEEDELINIQKKSQELLAEKIDENIKRKKQVKASALNIEEQCVNIGEQMYDLIEKEFHTYKPYLLDNVSYNSIDEDFDKIIILCPKSWDESFVFESKDSNVNGVKFDAINICDCSLFIVGTCIDCLILRVLECNATVAENSALAYKDEIPSIDDSDSRISYMYTKMDNVLNELTNVNLENKSLRASNKKLGDQINLINDRYIKEKRTNAELMKENNKLIVDFSPPPKKFYPITIFGFAMWGLTILSFYMKWIHF